MRILFCNWRDLRHNAAGGAEVYAHELLRQLASRGHKVTLFCAHVDGEARNEFSDGIEIVRGGTGRLGVYDAARDWFEQSQQDNFDLIVDGVNTRPFFCHEWEGAPPTVALIHQVAREVWFSEFSWPLASVGRWWLEPKWLARYRYVPTLTISASSARSLRKYGLQRVMIAPVGVEPPPQIVATEKQTKPTIIFVGRLASNKRPDEAIDAFKLLKERLPDAQLWMVGTGAMAQRLKRTAPPDVTFFGRVPNQTKFELMSKAHVLVVTSVREGWGLVVDEAASVGTATIAYDVDGLRDSVLAAEGELTDPHPQALAQALLNRLDCIDLTKLESPAEHGALSWDRLAIKFLELAEEMVYHNRFVPGPVSQEKHP